ncbi:MAG: deoxyribodipyrimidine photo-lyase [Mucilaginibacter polytrichastri]|nr:deoxyribodipyrimidine photo-lyase [Mucilaginibacter polytrichastri]
MSKKVSIFWFRRDLRLEDNAGLYHALKGEHPVIPLFIFDRNILDDLEDKDDARVTFIFDTLKALNEELKKHGSSLLIKYTAAEMAWDELLKDEEIAAVYTNIDYEPYARDRDEAVRKKLEKNDIPFHAFKDQVIFDRDEILKPDKKPYTVFSPYMRQWFAKLKPFYLKAYPTKKYFRNFHANKSRPFISLKDMGFERSKADFPDTHYKDIIEDYAKTRNLPGIEGTSRMSIHLRFGTVSIRQLAGDGNAASQKKWLVELIWRDFYQMILWHFPHTATKSFKPDYDDIRWRNNEKEFKAWCEGKTGYPMVDAGMRQLNTIGWMHNRVRMVTASFLCKHLLIDWRWGETYFARKLQDYDMASNVGGWQWSCGSGNDAAPYFRVFNPELQLEKFDPKKAYVKKWIPELEDEKKYPEPIVDHKEARERCLEAFKKAVKKA